MKVSLQRHIINNYLLLMFGKGVGYSIDIKVYVLVLVSSVNSLIIFELRQPS